MKKVTNLLDNISKTRDILDTGDFNKVRENLFFIVKLKNDIVRQIKKYIQYENHELDFNSEDVRALSDGLFDLERKLVKSSYSQLFKRINKNRPIEIQHFNALCFEVHDKMYYDTFIRPVANELGFFALVLWLWSQTDYKKDFMTQIEEHLKSFL